MRYKTVPLLGAFRRIGTYCCRIRAFHATLLTAVTFFGVIVGGTAAWWGFPPVALADANCTMPDGMPPYGHNWPATFYTEATNQNGFNYADYGVKAGTGDTVYGGGVQCVHVDSVIMVSNNGYNDFAEVGWHTQQTGVTNCGNGVNTPVVMSAFRVGGNTTQCDDYPGEPITAGTAYSVSVRTLAPPDDGRWQLIFNGTVLYVTDFLGFNIGAGVTNAERHEVTPSDFTKESAQAHFTGMRWWDPATASWNPWASHRCYWGQNLTADAAYKDPAYHNRFPSNSDTEVISTTAAVDPSEDCPNPAP